MRYKSCNFCGADHTCVRDGKCVRCGTSFPSGCKRDHQTEKAPKRKQRYPQDDDANGYLSNAVRELTDY